MILLKGIGYGFIEKINRDDITKYVG
ncbi:MAG: hypothetical protein ACJAX4_003959 [Clostridium sp.]